MKTLLLLRHAKSDWADPSVDDFDRPLNARGRNAAPRMAQYMTTQRLEPDLVWCSTARRARETWSLMAPALGTEVSISFRDDLYLAPSERIVDLVGSAPDTATRLMILGHNPGLHDVALSLIETARDSTEYAILEEGLPTAGLVVLDFGIDRWREIERGELKDFARPRHLEQKQQR